MSGKWINLGAIDSPEYIAIQSFYESQSELRVLPTEGSEDVFGDLRSLLQGGFTGGEIWVFDWSKCFVGEKQQAQVMAYLGNYFGRPITTMDEAAFEFDFFALKTLRQKMESAGLHARYEQPDLTAPQSTWGLDVLSAEQIMAWEEAHHRKLPEALKRVYLELFGGVVYAQDKMPTNWYLLDHTTGPFPSVATLETILYRAGVEDVDRRLSRIQYGINQLANSPSNFVSDLQYAKLVQPKLRQSLVLDRYFDNYYGGDYWPDHLSILVEFGPLEQHVIEVTDVIRDPTQCIVRDEGPLGLWLIREYLNGWLDLGIV